MKTISFGNHINDFKSLNVLYSLPQPHICCMFNAAHILLLCLYCWCRHALHHMLNASRKCKETGTDLFTGLKRFTMLLDFKGNVDPKPTCTHNIHHV